EPWARLVQRYGRARIGALERSRDACETASDDDNPRSLHESPTTLRANTARLRHGESDTRPCSGRFGSSAMRSISARYTVAMASTQRALARSRSGTSETC